MRSKARAKAEDKNRDKRSTSPDASSISGSVKARRWWSWWWWTFVERIETFCSPENAVDVLEKNEYEDDKARMKGKAIQERAVAQAGMHDFPPHAQSVAPVSAVAPPRKGTRPSSWREGLKKVYLAVPAFASPLTPVLNPLVKRAQWEIVVRSALMALFLSCIVIGSLLAVPE